MTQTQYLPDKVNTTPADAQTKWTPFLADDIFKCIFLMKMYKFWLRFHWGLFPRVR